jgi:branched-chain amino acid transport system substrate-binding protein
MSVYEAGYDIHNTFRLGAYRGGADNVYLAVLPYTKDSYDTLPLIDVWRQQKPVHAHALLSGKEGDQFLENLAKSELSETLPVSVNPFMVEDGKPASSPHLNGLQLINATTWCAGLQNEDNKKFVLAYTENYEKIPGVYSLLAYETGLALGTALTKTENSLNKNKLTAALHQHLAIGPRGDIFLATSPLLKTKLPVYIRIGSVNSDQVWENSITGIMDGIEWNEPVLEETRLNVSGWQNPYLCV